MNENNVQDGNYYYEPRKENFVVRHRFIFGILVGIIVSVGMLITAIQILKFTNRVVVVGGTGEEVLDNETIGKISEIYLYMEELYYKDFEMSKVQEGLYDGLIGSLNDPYSVYYTPEEYEDFRINTSGVYYGIGAGLQQDIDTMQVTITKVYRGTPAEEAGLKDGDIIISVEDIDATSIEVDALVQHIRGEEGTTVHMVVYRESTDETLDFDVERRNIVLPSVEGELLEDGIGYIQITGFEQKTPEQFINMVEQFKQDGMKGMVIDLRANTGGYLISVVNMLDYLLPKGLIASVEYGNGYVEKYSSGESCIDMPMVVLTDEYSASASEIFAGTIKDYDYATLVGKTTFGKGVVQNTYDLSDGDAIKLTIAKYYTAGGNDVHGVGVAPHIEVDYEYTGPENEDYDKQYDSQFVKALEVLKEKMANE